MTQFSRIVFVLTLLVLAGCNADPAGSTRLSWPLERGASRLTPLHFGLFVTPDPAMNPIDPPERFSGYHVGTDFEITSDEKDAEVPVFAICTGEVAYSGFAEGYGGLIAQHCTIDSSLVVVLYGHLNVDSLPHIKDTLTAGKQIALLGAAKSRDTDDNRKHLHLGIQKGSDLVYLGYVQTEDELKEFIDAKKILSRWRVIAP